MKKTFYLTGDIRHPGVIRVEAESLDEALELATDGNFEIYDEMDSCLGFDFCGDTDGGVREETIEDESEVK